MKVFKKILVLLVLSSPALSLAQECKELIALKNGQTDEQKKQYQASKKLIKRILASHFVSYTRDQITDLGALVEMTCESNPDNDLLEIIMAVVKAEKSND